MITTAMTSRFVLNADTNSLARWAGVASSTVHRPSFVSPREAERFHPVLRWNPLGKREITWMREGLIPSYACDAKGSENRIEAHAEAMTCDSCFRGAFRRRRCIIPATAIHEMRHLGHEIEHPVTLTLSSKAIFGIAGVWETWSNDQKHEVESFAAITTVVESMLRTLFRRMPVILEEAQFDRWLLKDDRLGPPVELLKPLTSSDWLEWEMEPGEVNMHLESSR